MYKPMFNGDKRTLNELQSISRYDRKSKNLWEEYAKYVVLVDEKLPLTKRGTVKFLTAVRSTYSNRVLVYAGGSDFLIKSSVLVTSPDTTFNDLCVVNAHTAFTSVVDAPNEVLAKHSDLQSCGIVCYNNQMFVYLNVLMDEVLTDMIECGEATLCNGAAIEEIIDFQPAPGSLSDYMKESLVIVGGDTDHA